MEHKIPSVGLIPAADTNTLSEKPSQQVQDQSQAQRPN